MSVYSASQEATAVERMTEGYETCRGCGSAVARDQRYCLSCGARRAGLTVPFAATLAAASEPEVPSSKDTNRAAISPALAVAIVCLSVLFLGTGVLVGRSGESATQASAAPQVLTVPAGTADAAVTGTTGDAKSKAAAAAASAAGAPRAAAAPKLVGAKKAALDKAINCKTDKECQDAAKKIPNEFTTDGTPPPVDGKAPAGGAKGQTFN